MLVSSSSQERPCIHFTSRLDQEDEKPSFRTIFSINQPEHSFVIRREVVFYSIVFKLLHQLWYEIVKNRR